MHMPAIRGRIRRRILVNYRVDAQILARQLPAPFRPQLQDGFGIAGICLIRLDQIRLHGFPALVGIASENVAHRIAVQWDDKDGQTQTGAYVARRDTNSRLNHWAGGRIFPGAHHLADFDVHDMGHNLTLQVLSRDRCIAAHLVGQATDDWPADSVFASLAEASDFFQAGSLGYSPDSQQGRFDGLVFATHDWAVEKLSVHHIASSYFDDTRHFPPGSISFDNALLMRNIEHEWRAANCLCA